VVTSTKRAWSIVDSVNPRSAAAECFGVQVEGPPFGAAGGGERVQQPAQEAKQCLLVVAVEGCEQGGGAVGVGLR
jgi:hypothetical protein